MQQVPLFITPPHTCSYLEDRSARMLFVDPNEPMTNSMLSELSRQGFRRSGDFVYKPECKHCHQCISIRVPVTEFKANKSQKRTLKKNQDLTQKVIQSADATALHYELYAQYICERHRDGDMYPPSNEQFYKFLVNSMAESVFIEYWLENELVCVSVCDVLEDGISAVYTFYNAHYDKRGLGTYAILKQIEFVEQIGKPYLYLGHWVPESAKMAYKRNFEPQEIFMNDAWYRVDKKFTDKEVAKLLLAINKSASEYIKLINLPTTG